jgi:hypothetical protein
MLIPSAMIIGMPSFSAKIVRNYYRLFMFLGGCPRMAIFRNLCVRLVVKPF